MEYGIKLRVWGEYACFTRPEMKAERVSYEVMTPSAARGILEAIYWKPAIRWVVKKIHVLNSIRFDNIRRNEVSSKIPLGNINAAMRDETKRLQLFIEDVRQQRASMVLRNVDYVVEACFEFASTEDNNPGKHLSCFNRRASAGQCFHQPYLGCREFPAAFELIKDQMPISAFADVREQPLGWMLNDIDYTNQNQARFFNAKMINGVIEVPLLFSGEVKV